MIIREWTDDEDNQLLEEVENGFHLHRIASKHRRTLLDIRVRQYHLMELFLRDTTLSFDEIIVIVGLSVEYGSAIRESYFHMGILLWNLFINLKNHSRSQSQSQSQSLKETETDETTFDTVESNSSQL